MALENIGAQLILAGVGGFVAGANQASTAINNFSGRIDTAGTGMKNFGTNITNMGNFMQRTGFILSFQLTAPLIALGKAVFNASTDFETAFVSVKKNVNDLADQDFPAMEQALINLSLQTGVSAIDLATIAGEAGQVGIAAKDIIPFTEEIAKLRVATNLGAAATQEFARIATLTGTTDFKGLSASITLVGANTNATETEIVKMAVGLAGMARLIGLTGPEVIGLAAGFSSLGIQAEAGRGSFQKLGFAITNAIIDNGKELKIFAEVAGQTAEEFAINFRTKPIEAILALIQGFGELREEGVAVKDKVFDVIGLSADEFGKLLKTDAEGAVALYEQGLEQVGGQGTELGTILDELGLKEIRIKDLLLKSASGHDLVTKAIKDSIQASTEKTATDKEFSRFLESTQGQLDLLKTQVVKAAIEIGKLITPDVLDAAKTFTEAIVDLAKEFSKLEPNTRKNILLFAAGVALLAPLIVILGSLASVIGLVIQGGGLLARAIAFLIPFLPKLLAETVNITKGFANAIPAVINFIKSGGILRTVISLATAAIINFHAGIFSLLKFIGPIGIALFGLTLAMEHTGTSFDDLKNLMLKVGALLLAGLIQVASHIAATFNDMQSVVLSVVANIARGIANLISVIPGVGNALQQGIASIAGGLQTAADKYSKAALDAKVTGDEWSASIINAANASLTFGKAINDASTAAASSGEDYSTMDSAIEEVSSVINKVAPKVRDFGGLLGDDPKKGGAGAAAKEAEEAVLSAAEAFEQFINSLSTEELAEYSKQVDINRIAQDAWLAGLHKELQEGNIVHVAEQFLLTGKTAKEAFDFITEGLKKIQEEGPRTSDEIVRMAKETRLFDDQWKFFESDAKRMISEGLITQVAEQIIQMGKTGKEAIEFITQTLEKLQEETEEAKKKQKELHDEYIKQVMASVELAAQQRANSAAYIHDLIKEREALEAKRLKELEIQHVQAATARMLRNEAQEDRGEREKKVSEKINRLNEAAERGNWGVAARLIDQLEGTDVGATQQRIISAISDAIREAGWEFKFVPGEGAMWTGPSFQHGGITPGSPSKSMLAQVHGSETIIPASLRNMEFSLVNRLAGMLGSLGNQFTVNANYTNTQSPASISLDMSALMAMAR